MRHLITILLFACCASCASTSPGKKLAVRKVDHLKGNAWLVTTDSGLVIKYTKGMGRYKPDSVVIR
jgi:hypothetical protein